MKISAKAEYALLAMMELVQGYGARDVISVEEIANKQGIPQKYLVHILIQLKKSGLIDSRRGYAGGYVLARDPARVTLGDVIRVMEGPILQLRSTEPDAARSPGFQFFWDGFRDRIEHTLDSISMLDVQEHIASGQSPMYYI